MTEKEISQRLMHASVVEAHLAACQQELADYKEALAQYIDHVAGCEGIDFLSAQRLGYIEQPYRKILEEARMVSISREKKKGGG